MKFSGNAENRQIGNLGLIFEFWKNHVFAMTCFLDVCCQMIDDAGFRGRMQRRMKIADLDSTVLSLEHVPAFARAIDYILDNHDSLKEEGARNPITVT